MLELDKNKMTRTEFMQFAWKQLETQPAPSIDEERIQVEEQLVYVDCRDGAFFGEGVLRTLEVRMEKPVIVLKNRISDDFGDESKGYAYLTDCIGERKVSRLLGASVDDPRKVATILTRRDMRYSGVPRQYLESKLEVFKITDWDTGDYEVVECSLSEYLTNYDLHTNESFHMVMQAEARREGHKTKESSIRTSTDTKPYPGLVDVYASQGIPLEAFEKYSDPALVTVGKRR
jgi:hypothetical protein